MTGPADQSLHGSPSKRPWRLAATIAGVTLVLDQVSKLLVTRSLELYQIIDVFPGFNLLLTRNTGVSFSFLQNLPVWVVAALNLLIILIVGWVWLRERHPGISHELAFGLILGGAAGNVIDRLRLGYVVDFISLYAFDWYFAIFNIADSAISIGAVLLIANLFISPSSAR